MFTKQIVMTLPLMILLVEFTFLHPLKAEETHKPLKKSYIVIILLCLLIVPAIYTKEIIGLLTTSTPVNSSAKVRAGTNIRCRESALSSSTTAPEAAATT